MTKVKEAIEQSRDNGDLWAQLDEALSQVAPTRPPDSFTRLEFQQRLSIGEDKATKLLLKLQRAGKVRKEGGGANCYYVMVKT